MKFILFSLALLLTTHIAFSQDWTPITSSTNDITVETLKYIGANYVVQKGLFEVSGSKLVNGRWDLADTESIETRTNGDITYYRFSVKLGTEWGKTNLIRARYTVSLRASNQRILISSWSYTKLGKVAEENPANGTYLDAREFTGGYGIFGHYTDEAIPVVVEDAIEKGVIPDSTYTKKFVYSAIQEGSVFTWTLTLTDSKGNYYRFLITRFNELDPPYYTLDPVYN